LRARPGHAAGARARRAHGRDPQPAAVPAVADGGAGRRALCGRERVHRRHPGRAGAAFPGRAARVPAHGGDGLQGDPRERRALRRDRGEARRGAGQVQANVQRRAERGARLIATTQDIRRRIRSVTNTRKITRALELVASAKLRKAQLRIEAMRPYADRMLELMAGTARASTSVRGLPLLQQREEVRKVALVPIAGDRGLSGPFNSQVIRRALAIERQLRGEGKEILWVPVGRKPAGTLRFRRYRLAAEFAAFTHDPRYADAQAVAHKLEELYTAGEIDRATIVYN